MTTVERFATVPSPWRRCALPPSHMPALLYRAFDGLLATAALERYTDPDVAPNDTPGLYIRVAISRPNRYPSWDEMRDFLRSCNLFDRERDIFMLLPPDREYINVHPNTFHWWQKVHNEPR